MSAKDGSSAKKEKSFNGTKAKYSPNATVPDKKEVKLRRKDSEKVKQSGDSSRKSVLGRLFHNFVDSDDSRKKAALGDSKKKRSSKDIDGQNADLDLPEHRIGIVPGLRNPQTLPKDLQPVPVPNLRHRAMTLVNQNRDPRNRWSSYDIHGVNFTDGVTSQPAMPQNNSTLGHRWQSEETLNLSPSSDPKFSKIADGFANHPADSGKQPVAMRKHAQLLQSIEKAQASRANWPSEKTNDCSGGQGSNGWLLTTAEMGADLQKKDNNLKGQNLVSDQKQSKLPSASSSNKPLSIGDISKQTQPPSAAASVSSDSSVLLNEKTKQINKALAEKRRILSRLFKTSEDDMLHLMEKDVDLSKDMSVRKMILISLLQSDNLTSVINSALVPCKNVSSSADGKAGDEKISDQSVQLLHDSALMLHRHLTLLVRLVNQDAEEISCLKKNLEESKQQLEMKNTPKDSTSAKSDIIKEVTLNDDAVGDPGHYNNSLIDIKGQDIENTKDNEEVKFEGKENDVEEEIKGEEKTDKYPYEEDMPLKNVDLTKVVVVLSADTENEAEVNKQLSSDSSSNVLQPTVDFTETADNVVEQPHTVSVPEETACGQQDSISKCKSPGQSEALAESSEISGHLCDEFIYTDEVKVNVTKTDDMDTERPGEGDEVAILPYADCRGMFRNLESIPEDDDRLSCCDAEQQIPNNEVVSQEVFENDVQITNEDSDDEKVYTEVLSNNIQIITENSDEKEVSTEAQSNKTEITTEDTDDEDINRKALSNDISITNEDTDDKDTKMETLSDDIQVTSEDVHDRGVSTETSSNDIRITTEDDVKEINAKTQSNNIEITNENTDDKEINTKAQSNNIDITNADGGDGEIKMQLLLLNDVQISNEDADDEESDMKGLSNDIQSTNEDTDDDDDHDHDDDDEIKMKPVSNDIPSTNEDTDDDDDDDDDDDGDGDDDEIKMKPVSYDIQSTNEDTDAAADDDDEIKMKPVSNDVQITSKDTDDKEIIMSNMSVDVQITIEDADDEEIRMKAVSNEEADDLPSVQDETSAAEEVIVCKSEDCVRSNLEENVQSNVVDSSQSKLDIDVQSSADDVLCVTDDSISCMDENSKHLPEVPVEVVVYNVGDSIQSDTKHFKKDDDCSDATLSLQNALCTVNKSDSVFLDGKSVTIVQSCPANDLSTAGAADSSTPQSSDMLGEKLECKMQEFSGIHIVDDLESKQLSESVVHNSSETEIPVSLTPVDNTPKPECLLVPKTEKKSESEEKVNSDNSVELILANENVSKTIFVANTLESLDPEIPDTLDLDDTSLTEHFHDNLVKQVDGLE